MPKCIDENASTLKKVFLNLNLKIKNIDHYLFIILIS